MLEARNSFQLVTDDALVRVIIAEKPSLGRAIAAAIPGPQQSSRHHISCATGDIVAWCAGHCLELAPPMDYSEELAAWKLETLPIIPDKWKHRVSSRDLVEAIGKLLAKASSVVHAGDPDREGQLIVDELLQFHGWRGPVARLLITDLTPSSVRRALDAMDPNARFRPLLDAALARQRADWIYGINLTRLYTLRARLGGSREVLSVGRVQTPVLGLVVRRDLEIEGFLSKPFYIVDVTLRTAGGEQLQARWAPGKEHEGHTDSDGRLLSRGVAESACKRVAGQRGLVAKYEHQPRTEGPPLPYSLAALQVDAGRKLDLTAAQVLETAQRLYERQLISYPRSDCSYLPELLLQQARGVVGAVARRAPRLAQACAGASLTLRSKAWNDGKITAHHAIIPTADGPGIRDLEGDDLRLYELVALRYLQQFFPAHEYLQTTVEVSIAGETFCARGRRVTTPGWKALDSQPAPDELEDPVTEPEQMALPVLRLGQPLLCASANVADRQTQPPKAFTDSSLIQAMCQIAKYVADPQAKRVLQDADGIGTPATRAAILETLFARGFLARVKKQIRSTELGRSLIAAVPTTATTPDMTAMWERGMRRIQEGGLSLERFCAIVTEEVREIVAHGKAQGALAVAAPPRAPLARARARRTRQSPSGRPGSRTRAPGSPRPPHHGQRPPRGGAGSANGVRG